MKEEIQWGIVLLLTLGLFIGTLMWIDHRHLERMAALGYIHGIGWEKAR